ncbi:MAG TPA: hypothetical protein VMT35_13340 [Ignavibacteriaceae bacterium]|nr:hypothetical protein [Ignavibacteriaceae bacterium]
MQNGNYIDENFPRDLTIQERMLLDSILPENKPGYKIYKEKMCSLAVTGFGRFGSGNLILGNREHKPDVDSPSAPVFAVGTFACPEGEIDITIHEERFKQIETSISPGSDFNFKGTDLLPEELVKVSSWSYSDWIPGEKAPKDNSKIREINLFPSRYLLAIAPLHKKIWLHEYESGVNHLIPVTNFYNYLMIVKDIRDIKIAGNQSLFFKEPDLYSNDDLISAFILYNNYFKRFTLNLPAEREKMKRSLNSEYPAEIKQFRNIFFRFHKRGKN